jgi:hypothetical protein
MRLFGRVHQILHLILHQIFFPLKGRLLQVRTISREYRHLVCIASLHLFYT